MGLTLWGLFATASLGWYVAIWTVCLTGLMVARKLFLPPLARSPLSYNEDPNPDTSRDSAPLTSADINENSVAPLSGPPVAPGLSVLRPLAGHDANLDANLSSMFEQLYPRTRYEIIMSVADASDPSFRVAQDVRARYPSVKSIVIVGDEQAGVNPKINNLVRAYAQASFDLIWVVDSQVWLPPGAAGRAVQSLLMPTPAPPPAWLGRKPHSPRVGLVHHVPLAVKPSSNWGSQVERVFLSTTHAKMYLAINTLSVDSCVMGKSNMYRRSDLARVPDSYFGVDASGSRGEAGAIGSSAFAQPPAEPSADLLGDTCDADAESFTPAAAASRPTDLGPGTGTGSVVQGSARALARFGIYLAEDNMLALSLWREPVHLAHRLSSGDVAHTAVGDIKSLSEYASRRMRWIRVRKHMVMAATMVEPLTESIWAGLLGAIAFRHFFVFPFMGAKHSAFWTGLFYVAHFGLWHLVDRQVIYAMQGGTPLRSNEQVSFTAAWVLRELLAFPIWFWAIIGSTGESFNLPHLACSLIMFAAQSPGAAALTAFCPPAVLLECLPLWKRVTKLCYQVGSFPEARKKIFIIQSQAASVY